MAPLTYYGLPAVTYIYITLQKVGSKSHNYDTHVVTCLTILKIYGCIYASISATKHSHSVNKTRTILIEVGLKEPSNGEILLQEPQPKSVQTPKKKLFQ